MQPHLRPKPVYFISDLHLGASYIPSPREHELRVVHFLESLIGEASELIMVGEVLDYWFEYRTVVPRGYTRFFGVLARLADSGVKVSWFKGNHDIWLFDYLRDEIGIEILDGVVVRDILGKRFLMAHGDRQGKVNAGFRIIQGIFRNKILQKLYAGIHPRWTIPFAHGWSSSSRDFSNYVAPQFDPDTEPLVDFCRQYEAMNTDNPIDYFIFGHRHCLADYPLPSGHARMVILGDWISHNSYGMFDGTKFSLNIFSENGKK